MHNKVHFNRDPVESQSRPLCNDELETLRGFERHIYEHPRCGRRLEFWISSSLCSHCRDILSYCTYKYGRLRGCYVEKMDCGGVLTFVEIPKSLTVTRRVLDLVANAGHNGLAGSYGSLSTKGSLGYLARPERTTRPDTTKHLYRISFRTTCGSSSMRQTQIWQGGQYEHYSLSRTTLISSERCYL